MKRYRLYVDESGTDDLTHTHDQRYRYLSLTGLIFDPTYIESDLTPKIAALKYKYFPRDPDDTALIFHRSHMLNAKGVFQPLGQEEIGNTFYKELFELIEQTNFTAITVVLDKEAMLKRTHWKNKNPYHYGMEVLIEKYVLWLHRCGATGDIMAEERKGKKDEALALAVEDVCRDGSRYATKKMIDERLISKVVRFRSKRDNITGLQITDLLSKPSFDTVMAHRDKNYAMSPFSSQYAPLLLKKKYDRSYSGQIWGYGMKFLP